MIKQIGYFLFFVFVCAACYVLRPGNIREAAAAEQLATSIEDLAEPLITGDWVKGMSVGIVTLDDAGAPQTQTYHFGEVHTQSGDGAKPHLPNDQTLYELGSISKVLTSVLLAAAVENGDVDLGTTVQSLVPEGMRIPAFANRPITLLDLSLHRSGLPRLADNMPSLESQDPYADYTSALANEFLEKFQLTKMPGSHHEYSNFAVSYLGHLLTKQAGANDLDEILSQRITGPLEMTNTRVMLADEESQLAVGHAENGDVAPAWHFADMPGAGGIRSSIKDMNRFMIACLQPPKNDAGNAIDLAFKKHAEPLKDEFAMGLGWMIARDGSTRFHAGKTGGYATSIFVNRQLGLGVCVLSNTASDQVNVVAERMTQMKAGLKVMVPRYEKQVTVSEEVMDRYVGRYQLAPTFIFDVRRDGKRMTVGITNQQTHRVYPRSETVWFYRVVEAALRFGDVKDGKAQTVTLLQNGLEQTAQRLPDDDVGSEQ